MRGNHPNGAGITRREFYRLGAAALVATAAPLLARSAGAESDSGDSAKLVTEIPANEALVSSLQYVSESEKEGQSCANCMLYTPGEGGTGKCQLFAQGVVSENGWCTSWAEKA